MKEIKRPAYQTRLTNRHVAKTLTRLGDLKLPTIVMEEIKRAFWFLSDDLIQEKENQGGKEDE